MRGSVHKQDLRLNKWRDDGSRDAIPKERADIYFFSHDPKLSRYYDIVDELICRELGLIQDLMVDLVERSLERCSPKAIQDPKILVIGSGTGAEVLRIIRRMPRARIVAVDFSPLMNVQLREKFAAEFPDRPFGSSIALLESDFLSAETGSASLTSVLLSHFGGERFHSAVIGFVTHHYSDEQKREFYRRVRSVLRDGGALIHGDLFNFESQWLSSVAHSVGERWIIQQLTDPEPRSRPRFNKVRHVAARLREAWVQHWNCTHLYSPLYDASKNSVVPAGESFVSHTSVLRDLGFCEVECPFRLWEIGVIWARL